MPKAKQPVSIDGVEFDALLEEERTLEAESPDYPIEEGFSVGDAIIIKPQTLSMTLFATDTPVTWLKRGHGGAGWTESVISRLEDLYFSKRTVTVVTSSRAYKNMAIMSVSLAKSADVGYARQIPITFKEIRVTSSRTTTIPDSYGKSGQSGANAGAASTSVSATPPGDNSQSDGASRASILYSLANSAGLF